jgi:hypothetical protein
VSWIQGQSGPDMPFPKGKVSLVVPPLKKKNNSQWIRPDKVQRPFYKRAVSPTAIHQEGFPGVHSNSVRGTVSFYLARSSINF